MNDKFNLDNIIGSEEQQSRKRESKPKSTAEIKETKPTKPSKPSEEQNDKKKETFHKEKPKRVGRRHLREQQTVSNLTVSLYPVDKEIISALAARSDLSKRQVIEQLMDSYFEGREKQLEKILDEYRNGKAENRKDLLE